MINYTSEEISKKISDIQEKWANSVIEIGKAYLDKKDYVNLTENFIDDLYNFQQGKILFKPTKASHKQFRNKKEEFISYFIGHNKISDEDKGFALEPWVDVVFDNHGFYFHQGMFIAMGEYTFSNQAQEKAKVEYTLGYVKDAEGALKIVVHHSSFPASSH